MPKVSDYVLRLATHMFEAPQTASMARELLAARPAVDALRELCRLKLLKEAAGATPEYERDKPAAWAAAMTAVAAFDEVTR